MTDRPAPAVEAPEESARSTRLPREERRRQLLGCARAVFAAEGYAGASMDQIAERAEVSKPVLYQHFPGKHELFLELLDAEVADLQERLGAAMDARRGRENRERVRATVAAFFEYMGAPERTHRLVFDSGADQDPEVRSRSEAVHRLLSSEITRTISADTSVGEAEAEVLSRGLVGLLLGAARHWADRLDVQARPPAAEMARTVDALVWRGLATLPTDEDAL
ncbi:TetR/AcrR family transcriptional regulator [Micrococcus sp. HG099]|uniref:TetR/AcrR family transcriptional regulator n=1 Tax=Micrococcus sp. HG099 TaxID=2969755 RepID=UPI00215B650B|nr:TetR/AcrR family transcriptional regulator [Micrococcus sp. HG099]MCR8675195.1 TetR/AcrR family transcriptional regulator [Micrococcus sp. HG099]